MRLDKYLSECGYSRKDAVLLIKNGSVFVDESVCKQKEFKIDENKNRVFVGKNEIKYEKYVYIMMNKPSGILSATEDKSQKTVLDLLPINLNKKKLFPVGRLDKDTVGLLILTNDGDYCHKMIAPKNNIEKIYKFSLCDGISDNQVNNIQNGVELKDGFKTKPCKIEMNTEKDGMITITEGKYHEIRRMFASQGNKVCFLERIKEGNLCLDNNLQRGEWRFLTESEIEK